MISKISKISLLVGTLVFLLLGLASLSIYDISAISEELTEIAEEDSPLNNSLAKITVHQLEQAIWLERAALAGGLASQAEAEFVRYGRLIEAELTDAAALAQHGIKKFKNIAAQQEYLQGPRT